MSTGAAIAADGLVDLYEFLRLYCWEEIPNLEKALKIAKPRHRQIVDEANEKRKTLADIEASDIQASKKSTKAPPRNSSSTPASASTSGAAHRKKFAIASPLLGAVSAGVGAGEPGEVAGTGAGAGAGGGAQSIKGSEAGLIRGIKEEEEEEVRGGEGGDEVGGGSGGEEGGGE